MARREDILATRRLASLDPSELRRVCEDAVDRLLDMAARGDVAPATHVVTHMDRHVAASDVVLRHTDSDEPDARRASEAYDASVENMARILGHNKTLDRPEGNRPRSYPYSTYGTNGSDARADVARACETLVRDNRETVVEWLETAVRTHAETPPGKWPRQDELQLTTHGASPSHPRSPSSQAKFRAVLRRHGMSPVATPEARLRRVWPKPQRTYNTTSATVLEREVAKRSGDDFRMLCQPMADSEVAKMPMGTNVIAEVLPVDPYDPKDQMPVRLVAWNTRHATLSLSFDPTSPTLAVPNTLYPSAYVAPDEIAPDVMSREEVALRDDATLSRVVAPACARLLSETPYDAAKRARDEGRHLVSPDEPLVVATKLAFAAEGADRWEQFCDLQMGTLRIRHRETGWEIRVDDEGARIETPGRERLELPLLQEKMVTPDNLSHVMRVGHDATGSWGRLNTHYIGLLHKMPHEFADDLKSAEEMVSVLAQMAGRPELVPTPHGMSSPYPLMGSTLVEPVNDDRPLLERLREMRDAEPDASVARAERWELETYGSVVRQPTGTLTMYEQLLPTDERDGARRAAMRAAGMGPDARRGRAKEPEPFSDPFADDPTADRIPGALMRFARPEVAERGKRAPVPIAEARPRPAPDMCMSL